MDQLIATDQWHNCYFFFLNVFFCVCQLICLIFVHKNLHFIVSIPAFPVAGPGQLHGSMVGSGSYSGCRGCSLVDGQVGGEGLAWKCNGIKKKKKTIMFENGVFPVLKAFCYQIR